MNASDHSSLNKCATYSEGEAANPRLLSAPWLLPLVLSTAAGAVDVIGFLGLGGLFAAHITGNLVVLAAHYITGSFGEIAPLLSVPIFVAVLASVTLTFVGSPKQVARRALLILQAVLLAASLSFGVWFGPFPSPDSGMAVFVGMLGVAAMAVQNGLVRLALPGAPSTAVMTTNTAQFAVDAARLIGGRDHQADLSQIRHRAQLTLASVLGFVVGLVLGAILEVHLGLWSLTFPLVLAALSISLGEFWTSPSERVLHREHEQKQATAAPVLSKIPEEQD
jgi:uncharacterized membrane protein YoaK (UPF0700 family)